MVENEKMNRTENRQTDSMSPAVKFLGVPVLLLLLVAMGWFLRGFAPGGQPAAGMPGIAPGQAPPPEVMVELVKAGPAEPPREYIGHVESIQQVQLQAQVDGYLERIHFEEGGLVTQGDLLFTIQQDRYKAQVALNEAALAQAQADLARAEKFYHRLKNADTRSVVQADIDTAESDFLGAKAQLQQARAALDLSRIDLGYTEIRSPINGKIGKAMVTKGNYVAPGTGTLATIVQVDPIRVVFSLTDRDYMDSLQQGDDWADRAIRTTLRLPNGVRYRETGTRDFVDNRMNLGTGTVAVYQRFDNASGVLIPESYVTVMMEYLNGDMVPVVPQEAILTDSRGHYVYVVDAQSQAEIRRVVLGAETDGTQCVTEGLEVGERIIVQGVQKAVPGQAVTVMNAAQDKGV